MCIYKYMNGCFSFSSLGSRWWGRTAGKATIRCVLISEPRLLNKEAEGRDAWVHGNTGWSFSLAWVLKGVTDVLFTRPHLCCWNTVQAYWVTLVQVTKVTFWVTVVFPIKRTSTHTLYAHKREGASALREVKPGTHCLPMFVMPRPFPQLLVLQSHLGPWGIPNFE